MSNLIEGACHCGNLSFELSTEQHPQDIIARACDCGFCRMHATRNWSDPNGWARLKVRDGSALKRYRFGYKAIDFMVCTECGGYAGAVLSDHDGSWASLNLRLTKYRDVPEAPASYGSQSADERVARRKEVWTPVRVEIGGSAA